MDINKIVIVDHKPSWANEFSDIAQEIRGSLRSGSLTNQVKRIDHIGSTSVADLAAKDVIDIQITVAELDNALSVVKMLVGLSYEHINYLHDNLIGLDDHSVELKKFYLRASSARRPTHIHIREEGRLNQIYALLFRDYLRADQQVRLAYEKIKCELAERFHEDIQSYYAIKDPFMDTVYRAALLWKDAVGWQPDDNYR